MLNLHEAELNEPDLIGSYEKETSWERNLPDELEATREESILPNVSCGFVMDLDGIDHQIIDDSNKKIDDITK